MAEFNPDTEKAPFLSSTFDPDEESASPGTNSSPQLQNNNSTILGLPSSHKEVMQMYPALSDPEALKKEIPNAVNSVSSLLGPEYSIYKGIPGFLRIARGLTNRAINYLNPEAEHVPAPDALTPYSGGASPQPNANFGSAEGSEFKSKPFEAPSFLTEDKQAASPEEHASQLMQTMSRGETPEQAGINLAEHTKNTFSQKEEAGQAKYNDLLDTPITDKESVGDIKLYDHPDPLIGTKRQGGYIDTVGEKKSPYGDTNLDSLHNDLMKDPSVDTAHKLQSQLGREIGEMKYQNKQGNLDQSGKNTLNLYSRARGSLIDDMHSAMDEVNPDYADQYRDATANWKNEVRPYLSDPTLAKMARGDLTNPTSAQVNRIFKNPEGDISKVTGDLGQEGTDRIAYIGMGKQPEENSSADMQAGNLSLRRKGLGSYINPDTQQSFTELNDKITTDAQASAQNAQNAQTVQALRVAHEKVNPPSSPLTPNALNQRSQSGTQAGASDANQIHRAVINKLNDQFAEKAVPPNNALIKIGKAAGLMELIKFLHKHIP